MPEDHATTIPDWLAAPLRELVSATFANGTWRVSTPVIAGSGNMVDVSVWEDGAGGFTVTDDGVALHLVWGAGWDEDAFRSIAEDRAQRYGAVFDGQDLTFRGVRADQLRGAIAAMANLTKEVVDATAERERK